MHARFFVVIPPQACLRFLVFFFFLFFSFCVLPYPPSFSVFKYPFPFACLPKSIIFRCGCLCSRDYGIATVYRAWGWVRLILQDIHWVEEVLFPEFLLSISLHNGGTSISVLRSVFAVWALMSRKPYQSSDWPSCHFHRCDRSALPSNSVAPERSSFSLLFSVTALNEDRTVRPLDRDVGFMVACPAKSCKLSS